MALTHQDRFAVIPAVGHMLNGEVTPGKGSATFAKVDPTTGESMAEVPAGTAADVDAAVASCREAFPAWRALPADHRRRIMLAIATGLRAREQDFSVLAALETGAPIVYNQTDLTADYYEYYGGWVDKHIGHLVPSYPHDGLGYVRYEPLGVIGALLSWNGPIGACGTKVAAALGAGNCVVIKPSELGPIAPLVFAEICREAGLPDGVLNIVQGGAEAGRALVDHPGVDKITYTGGVDAGRSIMSAAGRTGKPVLLELGGKSANIVFDDADLEAAIPAVAARATALAGQVCLKPARMLIQRSIYDQVASEVTRIVSETRVGDPFEAGVAMGPVITEGARTAIAETVERASREGSGTLLTGGERPDGDLSNGYFIRPSVFRDVDPASDLGQIECFGPVLGLIPFDDEEQAIRIANQTPYGLAAYVQTSDVRRAHRVAAALDAGYVGVNGMFTINASAPFGGFKGSGVGTEGGIEGLDEFLRRKHVEIYL
jgi:aldehyde dehydrogenase (NAD+)